MSEWKSAVVVAFVTDDDTLVQELFHWLRDRKGRVERLRTDLVVEPLPPPPNPQGERG